MPRKRKSHVTIQKHKPVEINGMPFVPRPDCNYRYDYEAIAYEIANSKWDIEQGFYRTLCQDDSFFLVYFVFKIPIANHPFIVERCNEVDDMPQQDMMYLWAREHFKSTIITQAGTIKDILNYPDDGTLLISYAEAPAKKFFLAIKNVLEKSELLIQSFPDILYPNPVRDAQHWSEEKGIFVQREGFRKEPTLFYSGLVDSQPTGDHYRRIRYDDIVTVDNADSPDVQSKVKERFDMSLNLGSDAGGEDCETIRTVVGTYYNHDDALVYIASQKDAITGEPIFKQSVRPATHDGTPNGRSVFLSEKALAKRKTNLRVFYCQQLLDPTPRGSRKLDSSKIQLIDDSSIPEDIYRFITIDPAGFQEKKQSHDSWAILLCGIRPELDQKGVSDIYILEARVGRFTEAEAQQAICEVYLRGGRVEAVGVEKVGQSTMEIHVRNFLRTENIELSIEMGNLIILQPKGRAKPVRIEQNLQWPLLNGRIHIATSVDKEIRERLYREMDKFPYYHDDILDALSYQFDIASEFDFQSVPPPVVEELDYWDRQELEEEDRGRSWMTG